MTQLQADGPPGAREFPDDAPVCDQDPGVVPPSAVDENGQAR